MGELNTETFDLYKAEKAHSCWLEKQVRRLKEDLKKQREWHEWHSDREISDRARMDELKREFDLIQDMLDWPRNPYPEVYRLLSDLHDDSNEAFDLAWIGDTELFIERLRGEDLHLSKAIKSLEPPLANELAKLVPELEEKIPSGLETRQSLSAMSVLEAVRARISLLISEFEGKQDDLVDKRIEICGEESPETEFSEEEYRFESSEGELEDIGPIIERETSYHAKVNVMLQNEKTEVSKENAILRKMLEEQEREMQTLRTKNQDLEYKIKVSQQQYSNCKKSFRQVLHDADSLLDPKGL